MQSNTSSDLRRNDEAEAGVLSSILVDNERFNEAAQLLTADDFGNLSYRLVYGSMMRLHRAGSPIEPTLLICDLRDHRQFDDLGDGPSGVTRGELLSLWDMVPSAVHCKHYARLVLKSSLCRRSGQPQKQPGLAWKRRGRQ